MAGRSRPSADFATAEQYYAEALAIAHRVGAKEAREVLAPTIIQGRITALAPSMVSTYINLLRMGEIFNMQAQCARAH